MTNSLSPAAKAILHAFRNTNTMMDGPNIAAIIQSAVDQFLPPPSFNPRQWDTCCDMAMHKQRLKARYELLAVADELKGLDVDGSPVAEAREATSINESLDHGSDTIGNWWGR